jgi:hypothetical protein
VLTALLQTPHALSRLTDEVRSTFAHEEDITAASAAAKLPYLTAAISEGMRIHPAVPYSVPRVVPKGGAEICGRFVAEGVSPFPSSILRSRLLSVPPKASHRFHLSCYLTT